MRLKNNSLLRETRHNAANIAIFIVGAMVVCLIVWAYINHGNGNGGPIDCKGTTGVYREYDVWTERWERYTVPADPACMGGGV